MVLKQDLQPEPKETSRIEVARSLMDQIKEAYPESKGMTYAGLVDWALRKLLNNTKEA